MAPEEFGLVISDDRTVRSVVLNAETVWDELVPDSEMRGSLRWYSAGVVAVSPNPVDPCAANDERARGMSEVGMPKS